MRSGAWPERPLLRVLSAVARACRRDHHLENGIEFVRRRVSGAAGSIAYRGPKFQSVGMNDLEVVTLTFVSWNQITDWLQRLAGLRSVA